MAHTRSIVIHLQEKDYEYLDWCAYVDDIHSQDYWRQLDGGDESKEESHQQRSEHHLKYST